MNAAVFKIEKKMQVCTTDNLLPYTQLNAEVSDAVNTAINQLFVVLERKKAEMHTYQNHNYTIQGMKKASVNELGNIEEVMRLYNTAVEPYLGMKTSLTQATKNQLLSSIRKIMPTITYLVNRLRAALDELNNLPNNARNRSIVDAEYPKLLQGFVSYMMILQQLSTGNVYPISRSDVKGEIKFYIDNVTDPDIQAVFRNANFNLDKDFLVDGSDPYFGAVSQVQQIRADANQPPPVAPGVAPGAAPVFPAPPPPPAPAAAAPAAAAPAAAPAPAPVVINPPPVVDLNEQLGQLIDIGE
jgi:hypothetical protein